MARSPRLEIAGGFYHVTSRGNARQAIFLDDGDRRRFLATLTAVTESMNILCHDHCLMDNHYHVFLETPDSNLSRAMHKLNGDYAQGFNRRHGRVGHLFQGRFGSRLVESGLHAIALSRYIALNPVDAATGITDPALWPWSSYRAHAGLGPPPGFLTDDWVLSLFHPTDRLAARRAYRRFVQDGIDNPKPLGDGPILGSEAFIASCGPLLEPFRDVLAIPRKQRLATRSSLEAIFESCCGREDRNRRIRSAHRDHGYMMTEIARHLELHTMTVSRAVHENVEE